MGAGRRGLRGAGRAAEASIRLGYQAEGEDPTFPHQRPDDAHLRWLAAWLVGEGWQRPSNPVQGQA